MRSIRNLLGRSFLLFFLLLPIAGAESTVRVNATVLIASNEGSDFDLDNDVFRDDLIELFSYSAYRQIDVSSLDLKRAERVKLDITGGYELMLTLQGEEKDRILIQAVIRKDGKPYVDTILSVLSPGVAFLGGPEVFEGTLIIVLETGF